MGAESKRPKDWDCALLALDEAIQALDLADKGSGNPPAKAVFSCVSGLLATIKYLPIHDLDHVELGLFCADICGVLDRGVYREKAGGNALSDATDRLALTAADIQRKLIKWSGRNGVSRRFHGKDDREKMAAWISDLDQILQVFNEELATGPDATVSAIRCDAANAHTISVSEESLPPSDETVYEGAASTRTMVSESDVSTLVSLGGTDDKHGSIKDKSSILGESPPLPPRAIFGRDELIEKILNLTKKLNSVALIGAAGVGKTSIALAVLHHDQVKQRFGDDRRFIRCDQFPASRGHLLRRLSKVIGAATKNPEDLTPLRPLLSSKPMLIILDNAEAILDPQGIDARGAYAVLEELSRFDNLCICITSRLSPTPPRFECFDVPTLSMGAALNAFYHIYGIDDRSGVVNGILEELDFHPLSITLLAAVAHQNKWDTDRLAMEWEKRRSGVSQTEHNKGLAAAIELSLASPTLQQLGHDVRALLGVVAFLPQGINENNLSRLFPTITKTTDVFNSFCALSLTCRSNGFITMLAPLRDYLSPKDPISSPLIRATKEHYFVRMSKRGKTKLMTSEEANVEHLLNIFTATYGNSDTVWEACTNFMKRLDPHEIRFSVLRLKIEGLPDVHRSKPGCLFELSKVFDRVGNWMECKRLLTHALKLYSERGSDRDMAKTLAELSNANRMVGLPKEGIRQAEEATKISERLGDTAEKAKALISLAFLLYSDGQFDTATQTASDVIALLPEKGDRFEVCESHRVIARVFRIKGKKEEANHHYQVALGIATSSNRRSQLFWVHFGLAGMSLEEGRFKKATAHIEQAKSHAVGRAYYNQGRAMHMQAKIWFKERRFDEARSEALRAADMYQKFGAVKDLEVCRALLQSIPSQGMRFPWGLRKKGSRSAASDRSGSNSRGSYWWLLCRPSSNSSFT